MMETRIVPRAEPAKTSPKKVEAELRRLLDEGARLLPAGEAADDPETIWDYPPRYRVDLFDTTYYLAEVLQNPAIRFFVGYVVQTKGRTTRVHPRLFYKDISLVWRVASHMVATDDEFWIGKGALATHVVDGFEVTFSQEHTTDLPFELQDAFEELNRRCKDVQEDQEALYLFLRNAPPSRIAPYRDFTALREKAASNPRNLVHGGRSIAKFTRKGDPTSLKIVKGYEPDFARGVLEEGRSKSVTYGGLLRRFRIVSTNRKIQWYFFASPTHVWLAPPQALTTELSPYGVRTIDVVADDDIFLPGFEYHYFGGDDPSQHFTQIPEGWAGAQSEHDDSRADASPWLNELPIVREFRASVLGGKKRSAKKRSTKKRKPTRKK